MTNENVLDADRIEERLVIVNDSDALCDGCGADPKAAADAARDPRWFMDMMLDESGTVMVTVLCPRCW